MSLSEVQQNRRSGKNWCVTTWPLPVETFDFIIIDGTHRGVYNLWSEVLDYFDAFTVGLTATPTNALRLLQRNIVAEYTYGAVRGRWRQHRHDVYEIVSRSQKGAELKAKEWVRSP